MTGWTERLAELLPVRIRAVDAEHGEPLDTILRVIGEQADLVDDDLAQLYENWFVETADPWAVAYLGELVGYRPLPGHGTVRARRGASAARLAARLAPRGDLAGTVAYRRRKGTLPLLEEITTAVAAWPAVAREHRRGLVAHPAVRLWPPGPAAAGARTRGAPGFVDVRDAAALTRLAGPFETTPRTVAVPRVSGAQQRGGGRSVGRQGLHRPVDVGVRVWRLRPYSITCGPAYAIDRARSQYTFSILGIDLPLVAAPALATPGRATSAEQIPLAITRQDLVDRLPDLYGRGKSLAIWRDGAAEPIPAANVVVADLSDWGYRARRDQVLVDPELGRIAFGARHAPQRGVWVSHNYAFPDDLGGGEYPRDVDVPRLARRYRVAAENAPYRRITDAYAAWRADNDDGSVPEGVIEIADSGAYQDQLEFVLRRGERLTLRAADGTRPVLRLLDWYSNRPDSLHVAGDTEDTGSGPLPRFTMDGLLVTGRGVDVTGPVGAVVIEHSTLVPGWSLEPRCTPTRPEEPSLVLERTTACVQIDRSILGTILVIGDEVGTEPIDIHLTDSVLDATARDRMALSAPESRHAHARLHASRSTVLGEISTHSVAVGDDSIFDGPMQVVRRGVGCLRFSYVDPGTATAPARTPRRYQCQPDLAIADLRRRAGYEELAPADRERLREPEIARVRPRYTSRRYGTPGYVQLAASCPPEIGRGAEDHAEQGVYHDLFTPQRFDNLRARFAEFALAGTDVAPVVVT